MHCDLAAMPMGEPEGPLQVFSIHNNGGLAVNYRVDTSALETLTKENYDFEVLKLENPEGVIAPNSSSELRFRFCPLEERLYEVDLPISFDGMSALIILFKYFSLCCLLFSADILFLQSLLTAVEVEVSRSFALRVTARGFHPLPDDEKPHINAIYKVGSESTLPLSQKVLLPNQAVRICPERLDFGAVPSRTTSSRVVLLSNTNAEAGVNFEWINQSLSGISVKPSSGRLHPLEKKICRISLSGSSPSVVVGNLQCKFVMDAVPGLSSTARLSQAAEDTVTIATTKEEIVANLSRRGSKKGGRPRRMLEGLGVTEKERKSVTETSTLGRSTTNVVKAPSTKGSRAPSSRGQIGRDADSLVDDLEDEGVSRQQSPRSERPWSRGGLLQGIESSAFVELRGQVVAEESLKRIAEVIGDSDVLEPFYFPHAKRIVNAGTSKPLSDSERSVGKTVTKEVLTSLVREILSEDSAVKDRFNDLPERPVPFFVHIRAAKSGKLTSRPSTAARRELEKSAPPPQLSENSKEDGNADISSLAAPVSDALEVMSQASASSSQTRGVEIHLHVEEDGTTAVGKEEAGRASLSARPLPERHDIDILDLETPVPGKQYLVQSEEERLTALKASPAFQDFAHFVLTETVTNLLTEAAAGEFNLYRMPRRVLRSSVEKK